MNYYKNNIKHVKGDTYSSALIVEGLGQALDSVYFTCRDSLKNDSTILFEKSLADGGIKQVEYDEENDIRKYAVRIDPYDTRNLQAGTYFYDLQITVNTDVFTIMKGNFILEQDASRKGEPTEPEIIIQIKARLDEINGEVINVTVFDKLDYLSETKGLIKESLNNLGSEITDDNTFRNYASKIDDLYNEWPKVTDEGATFTISNTKKGKMQLDVKGNTEQITYTGKNLFDYTTTEFSDASNVNIETSNNVVTITTTNTVTSNNLFVRTKIPDNILKNGSTYIISSVNVSGVAQSLQLQLRNKDGSYANKTQNNYVVYDDTYSLYVTGNIFSTTSSASIPAGTTAIIKNIQVEESATATDYEPYVGGTASPNPNYPQDIKVVTGEQIVDIKGKNLLDIQNATETSSGLTATIQNGIVSVNGTSTATAFIFLIRNKLLLKAGTYTISAFNENSYNDSLFDLRISGKNGDGIKVRTFLNVTNSSTTFTLSEDLEEGCLQIRASNGDTLTNFIIKPQLEKSTQATSYEPYQEQSYVFYLEDLELCKIGDYQDYIYKSNNTWYKYKAIGKVVLDGSETWYKSNTTSIDRFIMDLLLPSTVINKNYLLSSHFTVLNNPNEYKVGTIFNGTRSGNSAIFVDFSTYNTTKLQQFKDWLSTHNTILYYVLATPTTAEITDLDLIEQLNSLENAISYNNTTNIFTEYEEGNISLIISASALMKGSE